VIFGAGGRDGKIRSGILFIVIRLWLHRARALRQLTEFPAAVQGWVAALGVVLSSMIGLFFGIYPAVKASKLDPVVALRAE